MFLFTQMNILLNYNKVLSDSEKEKKSQVNIKKENIELLSHLST